MEGFIFGGALLLREICVSRSFGLAFLLEVNLSFLLRFTLYLRSILQVQAPRWLIFGGATFTEGFLSYRFGGLIFGEAYGGAYFRNFTLTITINKVKNSSLQQ